jgi:hypothetical protein
MQARTLLLGETDHFILGVIRNLCALTGTVSYACCNNNCDQTLSTTDLITVSATAPAAWRYSSRSFAIRFAERSTKLFDEFVSHLQIGKAPAIIMLAYRLNCTSVSRLNMSCLVKLEDPAAQFDIQPADTDGKLGDVGVLCFVPHRLIAATTRHV